MASQKVFYFSNLLTANGRYRGINQCWKVYNRVTAGTRSFSIRTAAFGQNETPLDVSCQAHTTTSDKPTTKDLILPDMMDIPVNRIARGRSYLRSFYCNAFAWAYSNINPKFALKLFWDEVPETVERISQHLAKAEYAKLHADIPPHVLRELYLRISQMTEEQRQQIALRRVDIVSMRSWYMRYVSPKTDRPDDDRYFEITAVFHVRKELPKDVKTMAPLVKGFPKINYKYREGDTVCMYRFRRNLFCFGGVEPRWRVDLLNHVRVEDIAAKKSIQAEQKKVVEETTDDDEQIVRA